MQNFQSFLSKLMQGIAGTARGINSQQNQKIGMNMSDPRNNPAMSEQDPDFVGPPSSLSGKSSILYDPIPDELIPGGRIPGQRPPRPKSPNDPWDKIIQDYIKNKSVTKGGIKKPSIKPGGGIPIIPNIKPGGGVLGGNNQIPTMPRPNNPTVIPISIGSSNLVNRPNSNSNGLKPGNPINRMVNYGEADVSPQTKQRVQTNLNRYFGR